MKDLILNTIKNDNNSPIQVYNMEIDSNIKKIEYQKKKVSRKQNKKRKRQKNRGEISDITIKEFIKMNPDIPSKDTPNIKFELKRVGLNIKNDKSKSDVPKKDQSNYIKDSRVVRTEKMGLDSTGFGFSKRNLISMEGDNYLSLALEESNLSKHNKFVKNARKQRSNIKINFNSSLTPKKKIIKKTNRNISGMGGKKLFDTIQRDKINEEVQRRIQTRENNNLKIYQNDSNIKKNLVKIRSHDDLMKKSIDFINGPGSRPEISETHPSLIESMLKKKEISQISLDYMGM